MIYDNFNVLRLIAACMVVFGHAFAFLGLPEPLLFSWIKYGSFGVLVFFIISGYLIAESWNKDPNLFRFFVRRLLRIFPALIVCTLLTVFIFGPLVTDVSLVEYFSHRYTYGYLRNIVLYISFYLPGVFTHNVLPNAVNGSLWSLPVEFLMYVMVSLLGIIAGMTRLSSLVILCIWIFIDLAWAERTAEMYVVYACDMRQVFMVGTYFWCGVVYLTFDLKRYLSLYGSMLACVILLLCSGHAMLLHILSWILLPYIVLSIGFAKSLGISKMITRYGDFSYGIYIYACPIQQLVAMIKPDHFGLYLLLCGICTTFCAVISWYLVEKPAMSLKPSKKGQQFVQGVVQT